MEFNIQTPTGMQNTAFILFLGHDPSLEIENISETFDLLHSLERYYEIRESYLINLNLG